MTRLVITASPLLDRWAITSSVRRDRITWPPSPDTLFSALVAAAASLGLLRRIVNEKHPDPDSTLDPATAAADRIVEHLERSRYEVRERADKPRGHRTP